MGTAIIIRGFSGGLPFRLAVKGYHVGTPVKRFRASAKIAVRNQAFDAGPFRRGFWSIKAEEVRPPVFSLLVRFHKFVFKLSLVFFKIETVFTFTSRQRKFHCPCLT